MSDCQHKHTGTYSPGGVYLYCRCMVCGDLLHISDIGKARLSACKSYSPPKTHESATCINCGFGYWDHHQDQLVKT